MADPLSIKANMIAVVTTAYTSIKTLNNTIDAIDNTPETLQNLRHDLYALQGSLRSLKGALDTLSISNEELSPYQQTCLSELEPVVIGCQTALDDFRYNISYTTSISAADERIHWPGKASLPYHDNDIISLKSRLGDCKQTLDAALGIVTLESIKGNQEKLQFLEPQIATTLGNLTGKVETLKLVTQTLSQPGHELELAAQTAQYVGHVIAVQHIAQVITTLHEHANLLKHCIKICAAALSGTTAKTGARVKYTKAFSEANQWVGNIGDVGTGGFVIEVEHAEDSGGASLGIRSKFKQSALEFFHQ